MLGKEYLRVNHTAMRPEWDNERRLMFHGDVFIEAGVVPVRPIAPCAQTAR